MGSGGACGTSCNLDPRTEVAQARTYLEVRADRVLDMAMDLLRLLVSTFASDVFARKEGRLESADTNHRHPADTTSTTVQ
eukprot:scaffold545_cov372-Pavlova_lutheri.AAC.6